MSVSQVCNKFMVISKKKGEKKLFKANIDLLQFEEDNAYYSGEKEIALGEYEMETISAPEEEIPISYTKILMESLKEGFQKTLKEEYRKQIIKPKETSTEALNFNSFVRSLSKLKDFKSISTYDYMLWELGLLCPLKFLQAKDVIFPAVKFLRQDIERLDNYKFKLFIDGLEVYKSIFFPRGAEIIKENDDFKVYVLPQFEKIVGGEQLKFHGYIYSQRVKIRPTELQGILIRIKDVAIGNYDKSILKYPREEGPIFSMISGEIFVEEGLENALNIDRNSFNETHPHYQELQFQLHTFFRRNVVNNIRERSKLRRRREKAEQINKELGFLSEKIKNNWNIKITFDIKDEMQTQPYLFSEKEKKLIFFTKTRGWAKSEKERLLQMKAIIAFILIRTFPNEIETDKIIMDIVFGRQ